MRVFDFDDEELLGFISKIDENPTLKARLDGYPSRAIVTEAIKWTKNSTSKLPPKAQDTISEFLGTICHEYCPHCGGIIPWSEMIEAIDNDGYCGECLHRKQQSERE